MFKRAARGGEGMASSDAGVRGEAITIEWCHDGWCQQVLAPAGVGHVNADDWRWRGGIGTNCRQWVGIGTS